MNDSTKNILLFAVASPAFFFASLIIGAYWTFPYDHVRDYIVQEVERGGRVQLEIADLEPSWLTGVDLEGVRVGLPSDDPEAPPQEVLVREATVRVGALALMTGSTEVSFDAELDGGGHLEGSFAEGEESTRIEAKLSSLDLRRIGMIRGAVGLPVAGRVDGTIDLTVGTEAAATEGSAHLTVRDLSVGDGETALELAGLGAGLTLEELNLGTLEFQMETERGAGRIQRLHADGEDAELWGTGSLRLARPLPRSSLDVLLRLNFKDAYRTSSPRMEGLFALLEVNPQVRPARTPNGAFQWRIQGSFGSRMRMRAAGRADMPDID